MDKKQILDRFETFLKENGDAAFEKLNEFFYQQSKHFYSNHSYGDNKTARQAWVSTIGQVLEEIVKRLLRDFCNSHGLGMTSDRELIKPKTAELEQVRRNVEVFFGKYSLLPDSDIIIYKKNNCRVIVIISVKNSFRERYTETPYWKIKLSNYNTTRHIRVLLVTPDKDNEISKISPKKARIVLDYELDGIYIAKEDFDRSDKIKSINDLLGDLETILRENQ
ncbi:BsaWI family type II restriction enzyme [Thermosynechococcus sp.]|uniref:BsaWI family type II restriction enzyme n=1 Tax=Thermosynechococcus sp. TaxID=2814275 RepID=UPI003918E800